MWDRVNIPIGIQCSLQNIFGALLMGGLKKNDPDEDALCIKKRDVSKVCFKYFLSDFKFNIFYNNYALFYEIINTLQVKVFTPEQLVSIIDTNRSLVLDSPYIDKTRYAKTDNGNLASDDDIVNAITSNTVDSLMELSHMYVTEDEFRSACVTYIAWYKSAFGEYTALNMAAIMSDVGFDCKLPGKRSRHYQGLEDMIQYYNMNMRIIKSLSEENRVKSYVLDSKWLESEFKNENKTDTNTMFAIGLKAIDNALGNLRRGNMLGIMGPPKGGKTRFSNYLVALALLNGYNVCVWPLEGTTQEWEAMQISAYMAIISYNKVKNSASVDDEIISISSADILTKNYIGDPVTKKQILSAKLALASDERLGRLSFMTGTAYVEDMFDELQSHYENDNPFDVIVVDSLVNVMSRKGLRKVETISEAYMRMKNFVANELKVPALAIIPAQLKQDTIDFLRRNPEETIDVTAGAESAETIRTPDTTIGLFSTKQERENNIMKFYCVATRHSQTFDDFEAKCRMESCLFYDGAE